MEDTQTRFLAVIGLYKLAAQKSASFQTIQAAVARVSTNRASLHILLYDNTPGIQPPPSLPVGVRYLSSGRNEGLAEAFNAGLEMAQRENCDWLITLDQDTELPSDFLLRMCEIAVQLKNQPCIAAIVPQIFGDGRMLSPNWFWAGAIPRWYPPGFVGVPDQCTFAFNSASVMRVSALRQIGGYNRSFWLDNLDSVLYHQLYRYGKRVFVAGDIQVKHHFSMLDKEKRMTLSRYHNILTTESAFWDLYRNGFAGLERTLRLLGRWGKHLLNRESAAFRKETARALNRRVFRSREYRIDLWKKELPVNRQSKSILAESVNQERPKVSVCMATCNGERFVRQQLTSVLQQLGPRDEVIVVDDASQDKTRDLIVAFHDSRISLIEHPRWRGVVKTFEHAVRSASGDILFLCDQDDLWAPEKVTEVLSVFCNHPQVTIVTTGFVTIDESNRRIRDEIYSKPRPFSPALLPNLVANRFQGSTMAIQSKLLAEVLPFPEGCHVLHDAWIGLRNTVVGGETYYIDKELLLYRRHSKNATRRLGTFQQITKRLRLCIALAVRWFKDRLGGATRHSAAPLFSF